MISSTHTPLPTQHRINTTDEHPCLQCNSNPRFQRSKGFRPTHWNAWPSGSATWTTRRRVFSTSALEYSKWHNSLSGTAIWTTLKKNVAAKKQKLSQQSWLLSPQDGESKFVRNVGTLVAKDTASHTISWRSSSHSRYSVKFGTFYRWSILKVHRRDTKPFPCRTRLSKYAHKCIRTVQ